MATIVPNAGAVSIDTGVYLPFDEAGEASRFDPTLAGHVGRMGILTAQLPHA